MDNSAVHFSRLDTFICIRMPLEENVPKPVYERQDKSQNLLALAVVRMYRGQERPQHPMNLF